MSELTGVLVVMETGRAGLHKMSLEALAAGQKLAGEMGMTCSAAVVGEAAVAAELAGKKLAAVWVVSHPLVARYTADGWCVALEQLIAEAAPAFVVFPHTYQVRDYAPALATRLKQVLISDVTAIQPGPVFVRQWMQGKLNADYRHGGGGVCLVSVQAGTFRADAVEAGGGAGAAAAAEGEECAGGRGGGAIASECGARAEEPGWGGTAAVYGGGEGAWAAGFYYGDGCERPGAAGGCGAAGHGGGGGVWAVPCDDA